jgi:8-oxo-dGTP pyrophosphatase MutT (NUDIX family)
VTGAVSKRRALAEGKTALQCAALPWRETADGGVEVLLVTSRETRRWIIPKGWPIKGRQPWECAAREAREEAGVEGEVEHEAVGLFHYLKRLKRDVDLPCRVEVYPLKVTRQRKSWPEMHERDFRWMSPAEAVEVVAEPELKTLIDQFAFRKAYRG